jgi:hypothetical protein
VKNLFTIALLLVASSACSNVQPPDYSDKSKWTYVDCGEEPFQHEDRNYAIFHEDYRLANLSVDQLIIVVYKPFTREILRTKNEKELSEALNTLKEKPWILFHYHAPGGSNIAADIFEYKNNSWVFVKSSRDMDEFQDFVFKNYKLR